MKKILITGNLGYVGPALVSEIKRNKPENFIIGLDSGFFIDHLTPQFAYDTLNVDHQIYCDIRNADISMFDGVETVIHLAAISNDPMGQSYSQVTEAINFHASQRLAELAKEAGVKKFVFASSCSVYGAANTQGYVNEHSELNPVTVYAKSKIALEKELNKLASESFNVVCLRFATACGASARLRLDLVLNDFVFHAIRFQKIKILSDGSPWRPLIDTQDMAKALVWASEFSLPESQCFLAINAGSNESNYQVIELAKYVKNELGSVEIEVNSEASPDKRSYKVDFSEYARLSGYSSPTVPIWKSIQQLSTMVELMLTNDKMLDLESYKRLNILNCLRHNNTLDSHLFWIKE